MVSNVLHAIAASGQVVRIHLDGKQLDYGKIGEKLVSSGISLPESPLVAYSLTPRREQVHFSVDERALIREGANEVAMPNFPALTEVGKNQWSFADFSAINYGERVTLQKIKEQNGKFCMRRNPGSGYVDILSLPKEEFLIPAPIG
jgi:hypothetical protein